MSSIHNKFLANNKHFFHYLPFKSLRNFCCMDFFSFLFFIWAITIYAINWIVDFSLKFKLDIFDSSLRFVSGIYSYYGFKPYTDFGFVYPPGLLILQSLFHVSYSNRFQLFSILFLIQSVLLISFFFYKTKSFFLSAVLILVLGLSSTVKADPFIEIFWISFIVLAYFFLFSNQPRYRLFIFLCSTATVLFKWERIFTLLFLMIVCLPILKLLYKKYSLKYLVLTTISSLFAGLSVTLFYLLIKGSNIIDAFYFVFIVPIKILPYRDLPIPSYNPLTQSVFDQTHVLYVSLFFYVVFAIWQIPTILKKDKKGLNIFLLLTPLSILPYATGRADFIHAVPFVFTLILTFTLYANSIKKIPVSLILYLVYLIYIFQLLSYTPSVTMGSEPTYEASLNASLISCRNPLIGKTYNSIFVGRTDYNRYYYSHAMLYLIDPSKKPSSKYISDEPGLQNTCYDGMKVSQDLDQAEKPMLALLETEPQPTENNKSSSMSSCRKIENWLNENEYTSLGSCEHEGKLFAIRLYN